MSKRANTAAARGEAIQAFQRREIELIASDVNYRVRYGSGEHYSQIAKWPGAKPGNRVLELGCGPGRYAAFLGAMGCDVVAVDPFPFDSWALVQQHQPVKFMSNVRAESLPFADGAFDAVACLGALLYFEDPSQALREMRRVLGPRGQLILRTINRANLYSALRRRPIDPATRQLYSISELRTLVEAHGFTTGTSFTYGLYSPVWPNRWWYLMNGVLSVETQETLSAWVPQSLRTNLIVCAHRTD